MLGPEHCCAGGMQSLQSLFVHAAQLTGLLQVPMALQVSNVLPLHCVAPGLQSTHRGGGSKQKFGHTAPLLVHMPALLQICR